MKARMVDDILEEICINNKDLWIELKDNKRFNELCQRINGQEVDLVFEGDNAFEKLEGVYVLPSYCWKSLEPMSDMWKGSERIKGLERQALFLFLEKLTNRLDRRARRNNLGAQRGLAPKHISEE